MGFVMLFNTAAILLLARPRIFKRTRGPLVDPKAFLELTYLLFTIGIFFTLWGIFIAYFYVRLALPSLLISKTLVAW